MPPGEHLITVTAEFPKGQKLPDKTYKITIRNPYYDKATPDPDAEAQRDAAPNASVAILQQGLPDTALKIERYSGTSDTFLMAPYPVADRSADHHNFGGDPTIHVGFYGCEKRGMIRFDLASAPKTAKVRKALLKLRLQDGDAQMIAAYEILKSWQEGKHDNVERSGRDNGDVTWSRLAIPDKMWGIPGCDKPGEDRGSKGALAFCPDAKGAREKLKKVWFYWDITEFAAKWIRDPESNHGVILINRGDGISIFRSSNYEDPVDRPKLILQYE
jgi:hypothetical protein